MDAIDGERRVGSIARLGLEHLSVQFQGTRPVVQPKIGHHGSENATPWTPPDPETGEEHPINQILDALLPLPAEGQQPTANAIASTERTRRWPSIPDPDLMEEIGKRVANARTEYTEAPERKHVPSNTPQPQRTDLEAQATDTPETPVPYIELSFFSKIR